MRKYKLNQILEVIWLDIVEDPSWLSEEAAGKRPKCECSTVGYYLKHDKEFLYVSGSIMEKDRNVTTIPLGVIKKVSVLRRK
jgi:hypothetical protein